MTTNSIVHVFKTSGRDYPANLLKDQYIKKSNKKHLKSPMALEML